MELVKIVNSQQMYELDRRTIREYGTPGRELMERAGRAVVEEIAARWDGLAGLRVVVVCGKGNNGGDGYVVARLLHQNAAQVDLFLISQRAAVSGDAADHLLEMERAGVKVNEFSERALEGLSNALKACDLVVDALLGIGLRNGPRDNAELAIDRMNASGRPVVAVDIPSGVDADTGMTPGKSVRATVTVTFGLPKVGHLFFPGKERCGALHLADIGFAKPALNDLQSVARLLDGDAMNALLPRRLGDAHKGSCGTVAVVAGSVGMTGAAALTADAALRAGTGRVSLGIPDSLNDILEAKLTEVMTRRLPEVRRHRCLSLRALGPVEELCEQADVLAVGPGLGRHRETAELVRRIARRLHKPLVVDADGLNACAEYKDIFFSRSEETILTPHVGEFAYLSGFSKQDILAQPIEISRTFAVENGVVLVLKGAPSVIASPDGSVMINSTGNAGMATAGTGDVLTGLIAGFWAQGMSAVGAASLAVYLHGAAGDIARERQGEWSLVAGDVLAEVPAALVQLARS